MKSSSSSENTRAHTRNIVIFAVKVLVAVLLIGWLVRSGSLELGKLRVFIDRPMLLALNIALFMFGVCTTTFRFRILLGLADVKPPLGKLFRLQMTAYFFNAVVPGNVGGDVLKALYVARDEPREKRTTILLVIFLERLLGVSGLILMAMIVALIRAPVVFADPLLRPLSTTIIMLGGSLLIGGGLSLVLVRRMGHRLDRFTSGPSKISKLLNRLVASLRLVSQRPSRLAAALGVSMFFHFVAMAWFTVLTRILLNQDVPYVSVATVFPLGLLSLMLPISPSGLGVGHAVFKGLFEAIGLAGGATVFNVYLLGQIVPCLLGVFPFLSLRRSGELPTEAENQEPS